VADGRKQKSKYNKEEITSPTVSTDALLLTLVIDTMEGRCVGTADVPGAYLQAEMDDFVIMKMTGKSVEALCQTNEKYRQFVTMEGGKLVIYLRLTKALYGCIKSAMLWYDLFSTTLEGMGFEINPYDACVANKMVDGKQCTIVWYVDDLKVSHMSEKVVRDILKTIESKFSGKLVVTVGDHHVYLGMDIKFTPHQTVQIRMIDYLKEVLETWPEKVNRKAATPATGDLFTVGENDAPLTDERKLEIFKHVVMKLLYVAKRCRLDIQLPIGYLCTRLSCTSDGDWGKLRRTLEYLNGTMDEYLELGGDDLANIGCWIDASFAVHSDMKSHTGGAVSLGRGAVMSYSGKQKINTDSTTTSELVGCSDYSKRGAIWSSRFLQHQGHNTKAKVYQDNESTIRLERNGRRSCGQKTRHVDIRYFHLKDLIQRGVIDLEYCPTKIMIGDFFTKPLQGADFKRLKAVVMGQISVEEFIAAYTAKERVEKSVAMHDETKTVKTVRFENDTNERSQTEIVNAKGIQR
jgi:hypothetical protein